MSQTQFSAIQRRAIWIAYGYKCFYCNEPLNWNELHIDHIIPEYLVKIEKEYSQVKIDFDLSSDFNLNALYNLVPTHNKCNATKSDGLFSKPTTLFYLDRSNKNINKVEKEIEKLTLELNKGKFASKIEAALNANLITPEELKLLIQQAELSNWNGKKIKLPFGVEFIDEIYDTFYLNTDCSSLYNKKLLVGGAYESIDMTNTNKETLKVSTLAEWKDALKLNYFPKTNADIKMSSSFDFLDALINAMHIAKMPKTSFISDPKIDINDLDYLSSSLLPDIDAHYAKDAKSIGDLVKEGVVTISKSDRYKTIIESRGFRIAFNEQFRADFNNDGIEDIFVSGWMSAVGGSMGFGITMFLTRLSDKHLIEKMRD